MRPIAIAALTALGFLALFAILMCTACDLKVPGSCA